MNILIFIWDFKRPQLAKNNIEKKNEVGGLILSNFEIYYKAIVMRTVWSCTRRDL